MTKPHRQKYGLGSIIKKAAKAVKKVVKSPIGKAALIGGGLWGLNRFGIPGTGGMGQNWWSKGLGKLGIGAARGRQWGINDPMRWSGAKDKSGILGGAWDWIKNNPGKTGLLSLGAAGIAAPFLAGKEDEEEEGDPWSVTPSSIADIRLMARNRHPSLAFMPNENYVQPGYYLADGGRAGLLNGGGAGQAQAENMLKMEYQKYRNQGGTMSYQQFKMAVLQQAQGQGPMAQGQAPRGYANGELVTDESMIAETPTGMMEENVEEVQGEPTREQLEALAMEIFQLRLEELDEEQLMIVYQTAMEQQPQEDMMQEEAVQFAAKGGRIGRAAGGIMDLGGMEKDYRNEGGFVALGGKEKADDVPARLSKNEFVFTADAVRNAGGGDIDQGAEVMQNMMENLEAGGQISEESQGAQGMYNQQQMLQSRMA